MSYKPALLFLLKFLGIYFVGNIIYGLYVEGFGNLADPITGWVTEQTHWLISMFYENVTYYQNPEGPNIIMTNGEQTVLRMFEGCNGINVIILYISFIIAYTGKLKSSLIYIFGGILVIHLANLFRIGLLYWVSLNHPTYMYFMHKYAFTGIIYGVIIVIWYFWIRKNSQPVDEN